VKDGYQSGSIPCQKEEEIRIQQLDHSALKTNRKKILWECEDANEK